MTKLKHFEVEAERCAEVLEDVSRFESTIKPLIGTIKSMNRSLLSKALSDVVAQLQKFRERLVLANGRLEKILDALISAADEPDVSKYESVKENAYRWERDARKLAETWENPEPAIRSLLPEALRSYVVQNAYNLAHQIALPGDWQLFTEQWATFNLDGFVDMAIAAAKRAPQKFGKKAFISSAYDLANESGWYDDTLSQFKKGLVEAHREGKLELSRADMVAAMPSNAIRRSSTQYMHAEFHFINL